jgi:hypothetical protein
MTCRQRAQAWTESTTDDRNKKVARFKAMLNRAIAWGLLDTNPIL